MVLDGIKGKHFFEYVVLFNQGLEGVLLIIFFLAVKCHKIKLNKENKKPSSEIAKMF